MYNLYPSFVNRVGHDAPYREIVVLIYADGLKIGVVGYEPSALLALVHPKLLERIFAIDIGHDEVAVLRVQTTIYYDNIAVRMPASRIESPSTWA